MEGDEAYKAYMLGTVDSSEHAELWSGPMPPLVDPDEQEQQLAAYLFTNVLRNVTQRAAKIVGEPTKIGVTAVPYHINRATWHSIMDAIREVGDAFGGWGLLRSDMSMAANDYSPEHCIAKHSYRGDEGGEHFVLVVNHDAHRFEVGTADLSDYGASFERYKEVVQNRPHMTDFNAHKDGEALQNAIQELLKDHRANPTWLGPPNEIAAIIVVGEMSPKALPQISATIASALPEHKDKIQTQNPGYRAAFGAVCHGYQILTHYPNDDF
ncbi:hypothetical protein LTR10_013124 [Elasticomyces elasticus]|uniref:Uncharacterized protein n=1 Tax=Exophiala sideris TaxID=1016849 RepID=A0ABR0JBH5_9EURO|nr:hypothetical protein LTR10_013124 [Elasticomyces elasticus]KAK5030499.1 hypothetical protein LTS07_005283 [Exophiala sideris]KAK5038553.1 hypothetical protein LTR13_004300 [Exophiala sideris]KAK5060434.1 hypothetical protein LTR69_005751 [Exophiala sideris]KAK5183346.1 hypothetical protein LTR44_004347 [Eurotiomycetes sp. CCFEE 6388]